ncbi:unnamed protein product [Albugo candida]|uniref:Uncharacterized protein n=1 Tax=Albugo candida TaxID=65357 RepID=A0A024G1E1_9STRA|nr:unnamed protein product [Albugo candida]|eukprot:CCI40584.1 unnamed protein product [Albugo candida]
MDLSPSGRVNSVRELVFISEDTNGADTTNLSLWHAQMLFNQLCATKESLNSNLEIVEADDERVEEALMTSESDSDWKHVRTQINKRRTMWNRKRQKEKTEEVWKIAAISYSDDSNMRNDTDKNSTCYLDVIEKERVDQTTILNDELKRNSCNELISFTSESKVSIIYEQYRCVFCLDFSPSTFSVDPSTGKVFSDSICEVIEIFLRNLTTKMIIGDLNFQPEIHLSLLVQGAVPESLYVLVQGFALTTNNPHYLLDIIRDRLKLIENFWASKMRNDVGCKHGSRLGLKVTENLASRQTTTTSLSQMLRNAVYALNSLPMAASSFLVIITDGVVDQFDAYSYDGLLMQLVRHDINCHFIQLGGSIASDQCFGYVSDTDFLRFLAKATGGRYWTLDMLSQANSQSGDSMVSKRHSSSLMCVSEIQDACFIRKSSLWGLSDPDFQIRRSHYMLSSDAKFLIPLKSYQLWREKVHDYRIVVDIDRIIEVRTREGFKISKILPFDRNDAESHDQSATNSHGTDSTRYLVFVLQWKQDVWIEYVVSITKEVSHLEQRMATTVPFSSDEWYVVINIIAQVDFLQAFESCKNKTLGLRDSNNSAIKNEVVVSGTPLSLHQFIRNVQDVDRVLLHLVTATASSYTTKTKQEGERSYHGFGSPSDMMPSRPHPVFKIIGNLAPVLWHRWFAVDRFEILQIIPNDIFIKRIYGSHAFTKIGTAAELDNTHHFGRKWAADPSTSDQNYIRRKESGPFKGSTPVPELNINEIFQLLGTTQVNDRIVSVITKWSTQRISQDLFLKFLQPLPHRAFRFRTLHNEYLRVAQDDRLCGNASHIETNKHLHCKHLRRKRPEQPFCIIRIERKNHVLTAFHVAFFSAGSSLRKQAVSSLKQVIMAEVNDAHSSVLAWHPSFQKIASSPTSGSVTSSAAITKTAIACHRMISRLTAGFDILALYNEERAKKIGHETCLPLEKQSGLANSSCCGGSDIAFRETFGSYMWHINWRWKFTNSTELVKMMKQIHKSRIAAGFWVLDWHLHQRKNNTSHGRSNITKNYSYAASDLGGRYQKYRGSAMNLNNHDVNPLMWSKHRYRTTSFNVESVTFGREILLEDKNGRDQCILLQYGMLRISETRLITSFWMEPHHGLMRPITQDDLCRDIYSHSDHAVGHERPMQKHKGMSSLSVRAPIGAQNEATNGKVIGGPLGEGKEVTVATNSSEAKPQTNVDAADKSSNVSGMKSQIPKQQVIKSSLDTGQLYLCENDLLQLITAFLFHCDRQVVASHHTFLTLRQAFKSVDALPPPTPEHRKIVGAENSSSQAEGSVDRSNLLLPPFSTARLLCVSNRATDQFLMYLEHDNEKMKLEVDEKNGISTHENAPRKSQISSSNLHLYTMLEETLLSLSDFEVTWTDINGELVAKTFRAQDEKGLSVNRSERSIPLWITSHLSSSAFLEEWIPQYRLSQGRCFAKLINKHDILLSFLPSLEVMETHIKPDHSPKDASQRDISDWDNGSSAQSISNAADNEGNRASKLRNWNKARIHRLKKVLHDSTSSDDIVLYWQRRQSFREGYDISHNNRHSCQHGPQLSNHKENFLLAKDYKLCRKFSREIPYGADSHLLVQSMDGTSSTGFFQVAFYEVARNSLSHEPYQFDRRKIQKANDDLEEKPTIYSRVLPNLFTILDRVPKDGKSKRRDYKLSSEHRQRTLSMTSGDSRDGLQSSSARQFREKMKRAHEHNFSRGVYISLREGTLVQQSDLMQAISSCLQIPIDLDITVLHRTIQATSTRPELFHMQKTYQKKHMSTQWDELMNRFKESFIRILLSDNLFQSVHGTEYYVFGGNESVFGTKRVGNVSEDKVTEYEDDDGSGLCSLVANNMSNISQQCSIDISVSDNETEDGVEHDDLQAPINEKERSSDSADDQTGSWDAHATFRSDYSTCIRDGRHMRNRADLKLNKDVAVATSNLSMPFFLRFEYVEVDVTSMNKDYLQAESACDNKYCQKVEKPRPFFHRSHSTHSLIQPSFDENVAVANSTRALVDQKTLQYGSLSEVVEWFETSSCTRIALRLITLTLPNEQLFEQYSNRRENVSANATAQANASQKDATKRQEVFGALPVFQRQVIRKLRQQIKEWCGVEILSILRTTNCIAMPIARLVSKLVRNLPQNLMTKVTYPLRFTADVQESPETAQEIFLREFAKGNTYFDLLECNGLHFVVKKSSETSVASVSSETIEKAPDVSATYTIPYWAYFQVEKGFVHLYMHSPIDSEIHSGSTSAKESFNKLVELTRLHLGVQSVCKRVNQLLLLAQLHESRTCNVLLLSQPRVNAQRNTSGGPSFRSSFSTQGSHTGETTSSQHSNVELPRQRANTVSSDYMEDQYPSLEFDSFFWPGQFECPLQYSAFFKLHDRLAPNVALNMLCTSALEQFQVHNRRHLFVYRDRSGHVFYLKISVSETISEVKEGRTQSKLNRSNRKNSESTPNTSDFSYAGAVEPTMMKENGILLRVFGISDAGEEVTHELCRLLERKLDEATLLILMKLLGRNAKFQLSMADLSFLCPPMEEPYHVLSFGLPKDTQNTSALIHIFKKVLCYVPYVRYVSNSGTISSGRNCVIERRHGRTRSRKASEIFSSTLQSEAHISLQHEKPGNLFTKSETTHPAYLQPSELSEQAQALLVIGTADKISPVYWNYLKNQTFISKEETNDNLEAANDEMFVINLNPELRIAPPSFWKIGKGLILLKVKVCTRAKPNHSGGEEPEIDYLPHPLQGNDASQPSKGNQSTLILHMSLWARGNFDLREVDKHLKTVLQQAICDYFIQQSMRPLRESHHDTPSVYSAVILDTQKAKSTTLNEERNTESDNFSTDSDRRKSLMNVSSDLQSISTTKLRCRLPISADEIEFVVDEFAQLLDNILPTRFRPLVMSKLSSQKSYTIHSFDSTKQDVSLENGKRIFRIIPSSGGTGNDTGSVIPMSEKASSFTATLKKLAESDIFMDSTSEHTSRSPTGIEHQSGHESVDLFYYVLEFGSNEGFELLGYNISTSLIELLLLHSSRILTWSSLRRNLSCSLSMAMCGLLWASPTGTHVIQPKELYINGGTRFVTPVTPKKIAVDYIGFCRSVANFVGQVRIQPALIDASNFHLLESTSLGKYLREFGSMPNCTISSISSEFLDQSTAMSRPRTKSNMSRQSSGTTSCCPAIVGDLKRESSSQSLSQWSATSELPSPVRSIGLDYAGAPSPIKTTKATSLGLAENQLEVRHVSSTPLMRPRDTSIAANALMAARVRARGGALSGSFSVSHSSRQRPFSGITGIASSANAPSSFGIKKAAVPLKQGSPTNTSGTSVRSPIAIFEGSVSQGHTTPSGQIRHSSIVNSHMNSEEKTPSFHYRARSHTRPLPSTNSVKSHTTEYTKNLDEASWPTELKCVWGPQYRLKQCRRHGNDELKIRTESPAHSVKHIDPLQNTTERLDNQWADYEAQLSHYMTKLSLFNQLRLEMQNQEAFLDTYDSGKLPECDDEYQFLSMTSNETIESLMKTGHTLMQQRYQILLEDSDTWNRSDMTRKVVENQIESLQMALHFINLLSYKEEMIFGNDKIPISQLHKEQTIEQISNHEGPHVFEIRKRVTEDVNILQNHRAQVFRRDFFQHLSTFGFRHLQTVPLSTGSSIYSSASSGGIKGESDVFASECTPQYFYYAYPPTHDSHREATQLPSQDTPKSTSASLALVLLKVQQANQFLDLIAVILCESDLHRLAPGIPYTNESDLESSSGIGDLVSTAMNWIQSSLKIRMMMFDFNLHCLSDSLYRYINVGHKSGEVNCWQSTIPYQNIIPSVRSVINQFQRLSDQGRHECLLSEGTQNIASEAACTLHSTLMELPDRRLFPRNEKVNVEILLRYMASHSNRYGVSDLFHCGTPDTICCMSSSGAFTSLLSTNATENDDNSPQCGNVVDRMNTSSTNSGDSVIAFRGYALLMTSQNVDAKEINKGEHCLEALGKSWIQLFLIRSCPITRDSDHNVLPAEKAMEEAKQFVTEAFELAAQHYERDLLWTRLLYHGNVDLIRDIAATYDLPVEAFQQKVGAQELNDCLRLSACTCIDDIEPHLKDMFSITTVDWQRFFQHLHKMYDENELREYHFAEDNSSHLMLLCLDAGDLMIHLKLNLETDDSQLRCTQTQVDSNKQVVTPIQVEICQREESFDQSFTSSQRHAISKFVNLTVHWLWSILL